MKNYYSLLIQHLICLVILVVACGVFLAPQLSGKVLNQGESVQNSGMNQEAYMFHEKTGKNPYWTNSMFGGMPTYTMYGGAKAGVLSYLDYALKFMHADSLGYLLIFAMAAFIGFLFLGVGPWLALLGAIGATFATTHIGVLEAGHNSKLASSGFSILTFAGLYRLFKKEYVLGGLGFCMGLTFSLANNHPQMTYYFLLGLGIFFLFLASDFFRTKDFMGLGKIVLILGLGTLIALSSNLYQVLVVRSYAKDTMRGGTILSQTASKSQSSSVSASSQSGLGYDYAMQWSDGIRDLLAFVIPGAVGGTNNESIKGNKSINTLLRTSGIQPQNALPLYWGDLAFTGSPDYIGAIIFLLFIFGIFYVKGSFKWGMLTAIFFLLLMSLGKNFDSFNRFLFNYLPYLNKFRTPNSIQNIVSCLIPVFSIFTLFTILKVNAPDRKDLATLLIKVTIGLAIIILIIGYGGEMFFDFTGLGDSRLDPRIVNIFKEARFIYLKQDTLRTFAFLITGGLVLYLFLKNKLSKGLCIAALTLLTFIDLFAVAKRYITQEDWRSKSIVKVAVPMRAVDKQILEDPQLYYRVFDYTSDPFQDAAGAYYHKMIGGYSPAKLRRYQDMIDYYLSKGDQKVLSMLNTKYYINEKSQLQMNPSALGNAWFIHDITKVTTPDEEIVAVGQIRPDSIAVVLDKEFPGYLTNTTFSQTGSIQLDAYAPNQLSYSVSAEGDQFAVFSDIWYGPDKGWKAYLDDKPVDHIRVNYILRGMNVPAGSHKIEFKFIPDKVLAAIQIGFWLNNLIGLLFIGILGYWIYGQYKRNELYSTVENASLIPDTQKADKEKLKFKKKK
ncbi:MAG: YfhO family protein [Saprospiraceae bacterium]